MPVDTYAPKVAPHQLPDLSNVHPSPAACAFAVAPVGVGSLVGDREEKHPALLLEDPPGFPEELLRALEVLQCPEGHHHVEVALRVRQFGQFDPLVAHVGRTVQGPRRRFGFWGAAKEDRHGVCALSEQQRAIGAIARFSLPDDYVGHGLPSDVSAGEGVGAQSLVGGLGVLGVRIGHPGPVCATHLHPSRADSPAPTELLGTANPGR